MIGMLENGKWEFGEKILFEDGKRSAARVECSKVKGISLSIRMRNAMREESMHLTKFDCA